MKKNLLVVVITLVSIFILWKAWEMFAPGEEKGGKSGRAAAVVPVEIQTLAPRTVKNMGEFSGTLLARSQFDIAPKVSGRLEKLYVNIGDKVKKGDLICELDDEEFKQQVAQARAELEVSQANLADVRSALDLAQRDYSRASDLLAQSIASRTEVDTAKARVTAAKAKFEVAEAQIKQRQAALSAAEVRLSYTRIVAEWNDDDEFRTIADRYIDEGAMLRANEPVVAIVDLSSVKAIINVVEQDFPNIEVGQATTLTTDAYVNHQFAGKVARRSPVLKVESRQARVEIEVPNPDGLLAPGMFVRVVIEFSSKDNVSVVPASSLAKRNGEQGVFLADLENMTARFIKVKTGIVDGQWVEIVEPALSGTVITLGQHLLEDGSKIIISETASEAAKTLDKSGSEKE